MQLSRFPDLFYNPGVVAGDAVLEVKPGFPADGVDSLVAEVAIKGTADENKVAKNLVKVLVSAGLEEKFKNVLSVAEDFILVSQGRRKIIFETARAVTPSQRKLMDSIVKKGDKIKEKINPDLIAGIKIIINGSKQLDASMQHKLRNINI
ncbi:MAG: F0F1 ATP synthase subunit delta [Candidatus Staskawiczbacteria bacterium]|nr:F0F1 ATP synthase subunit delta [Candidatus Staskawiczbacteria bacterium]